MTKYVYTILLSFIYYYSIGQIQISGRVTASDNDNEGLVGVNILEKGSTTNGTVTDVDGRYTLSVSSASPVLIFSYIGFETEEITVGNQQTINLSLTPSLQALSEIVVTAFG